jgi:hypothetical protein
MLLDDARLRRELAHRDRELAEAVKELERAYLRPTYRWRQRTVRRLESGRAGRAMLRLYRAARGRSSRSA